MKSGGGGGGGGGGGVAACFRPDTKSGGRGCCPLQARYKKQGGGDAVHCVCVCVCVAVRVCVERCVGVWSVGCVWMGV